MVGSPPAFSSTQSAAWARRFCWLLAGVFAFRVLYLFAVLDFDIAGDEAYYWDWGRRLDWCYYSKPPLIGWLMRLVGILTGDQWWGPRLASVTLGTLSLGALYLLVQRIYDERTGFFAALLMLLSPANVMLNIAFTIDSPLILCWTLALLSFWLAINRPEAFQRWLVLGLIIGIGVLAKQMMLVFPLMMVLFAALAKEERGLLKRLPFWLSIIIGMAFLIPVLWWNQAHGWITAKHMEEHFNREEHGLVEWVSSFVRFIVLQAAVYTPITWGLVVGALILCARTWESIGRRERLLVMFSAPALLAFALLSFRQDINPNWPAVFYIAPIALGAGRLCQRETNQQPWLKRALWTGGAMLAVVYLFVPAISLCGLRGKKIDFFAELRGWRTAGRQAGELYASVPRASETFVFVLGHRYNASQMAFNMPQHPRVYRWTREGRIESQYEVWPSAADKVGWDAFILSPVVDNEAPDKPLPGPVRRAFNEVEKLGDISVPIGNGRVRLFQAYLGKHMIALPETEAATTSP